MSNIWDEETVSEYDLLADDAEEAERIAEEYDQAPEVVEPTEEEVEHIVEEAAFDLDQEESNVVYNARLRLEQARLYEMLVNHNLFDGVEADPRAVNIVQNELKHFIVKRLEILMGLRQPAVEKAKEIAEVELPFNDVEVDFLKQLAYKGTLGKSAQGQPVQSQQKPKGINPLNASARKSTLKPISKQTQKPQEKPEKEVEVEEKPKPKPKAKAKKTTKSSTPKKTTKNTTKSKKASNTTSRRKQPAQQAKSEPVRKSKVNSNGVMTKRNLSKKEIEELARQEIEEQNKGPQKDWTEMSTKEKMKRIKEVNKKYSRPRQRPKDALPMPDDRELELKYQQREMSHASKGGMSQFNTTLANILTQRKKRGE